MTRVNYAAFWGVCAISGVSAVTLESTGTLICYFRDTMLERGLSWKSALASWACEGDLTSSSGLQCSANCDPCGDSWFGTTCTADPGAARPYWSMVRSLQKGCQHMRNEQLDFFMLVSNSGRRAGKDGADSRGILTNIHISDQRIVGSIPPELCVFEALRELDLDGGDLTGAIPDWIPHCFPDLSELDLSFNELAGVFPAWITDVPSLQEIEFGHNWHSNMQLTGAIPHDIGVLPKLRELELSGNTFSGPIPASLSQTNSTLSSFKIADNRFEGDLLPLASVALVQAEVHRNAALCGMVPSTVRFAHGYNPAGTSLGQPC